MINEKIKINFFKNFKIPENRDSCWIWQGLLRNGKYGRFVINQKTYSAHRISFLIHNGYLPISYPKTKYTQIVRHKCNNILCVNPLHLIIGTSQYNSNDMIDANRQAKGSYNGYSKLTESDVL